MCMVIGFLTLNGTNIEGYGKHYGVKLSILRWDDFKSLGDL